MNRKSKSSRKPTDQSRRTSSRSKKTSEPSKKSTYRTRGKSGKSVKKSDDLDEFPVKSRASGTGNKPYKKSVGKKETAADSGLIRLNKYLADAGICSRREADTHIAGGAVMVNNKIVTELGTKVSITDKVQYGGETLNRETLKYFLLNKPKGFITTSKDPLDRRTVMALVENACKERIYPVGRLDKNTLGLLLFTNDGDLAKKLTHPKHMIKKVYHVFLDKAVKGTDIESIANGLELEDGIIKPDAVSWVTGENDRKQVGIELHSGKNRIVRRIFEHLGYKVMKLDRVFFAGLTKKDLQRGKFRALSEKELSILKRI